MLFAVLGLDHSRALVHDSCKQVLINLILAHSANFLPSRDVTRVLVTRSLGSQLSLATRQSLDTASTASASSGDKFGSVSSRGSEALSSIPEGTAVGGGGGGISLNPGNGNNNNNNAFHARTRSLGQLLERDCFVNKFNSAAEMAMCITEFLAAR